MQVVSHSELERTVQCLIDVRYIATDSCYIMIDSRYNAINADVPPLNSTRLLIAMILLALTSARSSSMRRLLLRVMLLPLRLFKQRRSRVSAFRA